MKISCQSCHSKYNVADEKVQGKIVKIRCRKCGATIVVNASGSATANGATGTASPPTAPAAPAAPASAPQTPPDGDGGEWHVSVSDSDQRTMTLAELVAAYHAGVVTQETFIWTDGMGDWKPLAEVDAVVSALHSEGPDAPASAQDLPPEYASMAPPSSARGPAPASVAPAPMQAAAEPKRAAVKREARNRDLFATRTGEELRTAAAGLETADDGRLTGQRNENSVLFSLEHLTKNAEERVQEQSTRSSEDSGIIDLKALAAKAESMRPPQMPQMDMLSAPLGFAPPLGAPLGAVGPGAGTAQPKSKLLLFLAGGAGIAVLLVLGIVIGLRLGTSAPPPMGSASSAAPAIPSASASAAPDTSASAAASAAPAASASAAASVAASSAKPKPAAGGPVWHAPAGGGASPKPGGGGGASPAGAAAAGGGGSPAPAGGGKKNDCNCNGDLMCMMKCSTH
jgi:predicted Zn finger-like uncharacterized protein